MIQIHERVDRGEGEREREERGERREERGERRDREERAEFGGCKRVAGAGGTREGL